MLTHVLTQCQHSVMLTLVNTCKRMLTHVKHLLSHVNYILAHANTFSTPVNTFGHILTHC